MFENLTLKGTLQSIDGTFASGVTIVLHSPYEAEDLTDLTSEEMTGTVAVAGDLTFSERHLHKSFRFTPDHEDTEAIQIQIVDALGAFKTIPIPEFEVLS